MGNVMLLPGTLPWDAATRQGLLAQLDHDATDGVARWFAQATVTPLEGLTWSDCERTLPAPRGTVPSDGRTGLATPMHFVLALTDLTGTAPEAIALAEDESRALCAACAAHLAAEGVVLAYDSPFAWRVSLPEPVEPIEAACERPLWLAGESIRPLLPRGRDARRVERWMNELQMLLHDHPVNRDRAARRALPVNGVWLWGFDGLPPAPDAAVVTDFARALAAGDALAWQRAWASIGDRLAAADAVILGDARPRARLTRGRLGWLARLGVRWQRADVAAALERIATQTLPTGP